MGEVWVGPIPDKFVAAARRVRENWDEYEMTDPMLERAWAMQDSTEPIWVACRQSGYLAEACKRYLAKNPGAVRGAGLRSVRGTRDTAPSEDS